MSEQTIKTDYEHRIEGRPDFSVLTVAVPGGQTIKVEASSMAAMSTNMRMKTKLRGGFKRFLSGESLFINEFTAEGGAGELVIAPGAPGDMDHVYLESSQEIYLQSAAYVASGMNVEVDTKFQGLFKGFFSGESLFLAKCYGEGDLWFNTYGSLFKVEVDGEFIVDTGHMVAFTGGLDYRVEMLGGYKSLFFSGEGLVCRFYGQGSVWVQTRMIRALASWAFPFRPQKSSE